MAIECKKDGLSFWIASNQNWDDDFGTGSTLAEARADLLMSRYSRGCEDDVLSEGTIEEICEMYWYGPMKEDGTWQ